MEGIYSNIYFPCRWVPFKRRRMKDPCGKHYVSCNCIASCGILEDKKLEIVLDVKGCNFNCRLCWGYKLRYEAHPIVKSVDQVVEDIICRYKKVRFLEEKGYRFYALRFTGNEPSLQWSHVIEVVKAVKNLGIFQKAIIETNGVLFVERLDLLKSLEGTSGIMIDIDVSLSLIHI